MKASCCWPEKDPVGAAEARDAVVAEASRREGLYLFTHSWLVAEELSSYPELLLTSNDSKLISPGPRDQ